MGARERPAGLWEGGLCLLDTSLETSQPLVLRGQESSTSLENRDTREIQGTWALRPSILLAQEALVTSEAVHDESDLRKH